MASINSALVRTHCGIEKCMLGLFVVSFALLMGHASRGWADPAVGGEHLDFVGDDIASVGGGRALECYDICRNFDGCHAFTWTDWRGGTCWLKSQRGESVRPLVGALSSEVSHAPIRPRQASFCSRTVPILMLDLTVPPYSGQHPQQGLAYLSKLPGQGCLDELITSGEGIPLALKRRGASTFHIDKSGYSIDLFADESYTAKKAYGLIGMPQDKEWVLKSMWYDKTMVKSFIAFELARRSGHWAPASRLVHLFWRLSGQEPTYRGVYLLMEKLGRGPHKVKLAKAKAGGEGGYLWQYNSCNHSGCTDELLPGMRDIRMKYPSARKATDAQRRYLKTLIEGYWALLKSKRADLGSELDLRSFADYFLHTELAMDIDAYRRSCWFHKSGRGANGGKIEAGPVWDLDLAYGELWDWRRSRAKLMAVSGWRFAEEWRWHNWGQGHGGEVNEYRALWKRPAFAKLVRERWTRLRADGWSNAELRTLVRELREETLDTNYGTEPSTLARELERWPTHVESGRAFIERMGAMEDWIIQRAEWMDRHLSNL